ncbi:hypothetical protein [Priestia aryabhattai]|uniref:hypothetical protein n=1 Tax=Priestia aryabhattai TaxID=412384 RepID=UPI002E22D489|nr:hypothetical protein [Priestia aryabhattai]MED4257685.1 hypothetical protein [Priestia aryabhattai]
MADDINFFLNFAQAIKAKIYVAAPAKVINVYEKTADVKPLFKEDGEEHSLILDVPILKHAKPVAAGDIVHVNFTDRALDKLSKQPFDPEFSRIHNITDAVIVGVYDI